MPADIEPLSGIVVRRLQELATRRLLKEPVVALQGPRTVLAFEVKAGSRVGEADLRHLRKLRDALGERLLAGVILCTGPRSYRPDDRLVVMPIDRLWTAA